MNSSKGSKYDKILVQKVIFPIYLHFQFPSPLFLYSRQVIRLNGILSPIQLQISPFSLTMQQVGYCSILNYPQRLGLFWLRIFQQIPVNKSKIIVSIHLKVLFEMNSLLIFNKERVEQHLSLLTMIAILYLEKQKPLSFYIRSIHQELLRGYPCYLLKISLVYNVWGLDFQIQRCGQYQYYYNDFQHSIYYQSTFTMKKLIKQLKQPNKYTHEFLKKKQDSEEQSPQQLNQNEVKKHKPIEKDSKYIRKIINKPNQPSALRLQQINQTFTNLSEKSTHFISQLVINHHLLSQLKNLKEKFVCDCKKKIKFYCLKCNRKCNLLQFPPIQLPIQMHIVHHLSEKINKSSVAPMRFLTSDIKFYPFMSRQNEKDNWNVKQVIEKLPKDKENTYILFPHKKSKSLNQIEGKISNLIILDCTWFQTDQIIQSLDEIGYKKYIKLEGYESVFWRYNHHGDGALSSAQSIMHFFQEYQAKNKEEIHKFDDLMLLYALNLEMVGKSMEE